MLGIQLSILLRVNRRLEAHAVVLLDQDLCQGPQEIIPILFLIVGFHGIEKVCKPFLAELKQGRQKFMMTIEIQPLVKLEIGKVIV